MKTVRIYGEFEGESSLSQVANGFKEAFPTADCYGISAWGNDLDEEDHEQPGAQNQVGLYVGNLGSLGVTKRAKHEKLWVMVAPNSDTVGHHISNVLRDFTHLMAPSEWARGVLRKEFPDKTVVCAPHGVHRDFYPLETRPVLDDTYKVLHMSSSTLERKGTAQLLEGWKKASLPGAELYLSVPQGMLHVFLDMVNELQIQNSVRITDRLNLRPSQMCAVYRSMSAVCQPSRGEGFGFVPLEARCCGVPAIMTACTGHSQHVRGAGVVVVKTGDDAPIDDFPGALAPSLSSDDVADALARAYLERKTLSEAAWRAAKQLKKQWSWQAQLKEFTETCLSSKIS